MNHVLLAVRPLLRWMRRRPGAAAVLVACFTLGIGANATLWDGVDAVLLWTPAGVTRAAQVGRVYVAASEPGGHREHVRSALTIREYRSLQDALARFGSAGAYWDTRAAIGRGLDAEPVQIAVATHSVLPLLGVHPLLGRLAAQPQDSLGAARVAVIAYGLWKRRFGGRRSAIGQIVTVADAPYTVIGVLPRGFGGVDAVPVDMWLPLGSGGPDLFGGASSISSNGWLAVLVRRGRHASLSEVNAAATAAIERVSEDPDAGVRVQLGPLQEARGPLRDANVNVLLWVAALSLGILLIACADVSSLLLARASGQRRELIVRRALGAQTHHIVGQVAVEALALSLMGGIAALGGSLIFGRALRVALFPAEAPMGPLLTGRLVLLVGALSVAGAALGALLPAYLTLRSTGGDLLINRESNGAGRLPVGMRELVITQVTLAMGLLVAAGLFLGSLREVLRIPLGVNPQDLFTVTLTGGGRGRGEFHGTLVRYEQLLSAVQSLPQVKRAAISIGSPFGEAIAASVGVPGHGPLASGGGRHPDVQFFTVASPGFFETMGIDVIQGRGFLPTDVDGAPPVAVINQMLAKALWPGGNPIGRCFQIMGGPPCTTVIGIVRDAPFLSITRRPQPFFYQPLAQATIPVPAITLEVRTDGRVAGAVPLLRRRMAQAVPEMPYADVAPFSARIEPALRPWRLGSVLLTAYGAVALILTAFGLYGLLAYTVKQREREIGIRIALGADRRDLVVAVVGQAARWTMIGLGLGALGGLTLAEGIRALLYNTSPYDPRVFAGAALTLAAVAIVASLIPARRATAVDPQTALQAE